MDLLEEDHSEVLRHANTKGKLRSGDLGDEHVSTEDRIISLSLQHYSGEDKENVMRLFQAFSVFPEDVQVPH